jgi:hypothetical protein
MLRARPVVSIGEMIGIESYVCGTNMNILRNNCRSGGTTRKSDDNDGRRHIRIVTSQSKNKTINHQGHQSMKNYQGKFWCEGFVRDTLFGIDIAFGNAKTDDFTLRAGY